MPKKQTFEVLVTAFKSYVVDASSHEDAFDKVADEMRGINHGWDMDTMRVEGRLKTKEAVDDAIRHGAEDIR